MDFMDGMNRLVEMVNNRLIPVVLNILQVFFKACIKSMFCFAGTFSTMNCIYNVISLAIKNAWYMDCRGVVQET